MYDKDSLSFLGLKQFGDRLAELRIKHNISAREMSLCVGHGPHYISHIENYCSYPSMESFLYICDYLQITPKQFFDLDLDNPARLNDLMKNISKLSPDAFEMVHLLTLCLK